MDCRSDREPGGPRGATIKWHIGRKTLIAPYRAVHSYPRPNRGILVAITVMKGTLDSSGNPAM